MPAAATLVVQALKLLGSQLHEVPRVADAAVSETLGAAAWNGAVGARPRLVAHTSGVAILKLCRIPCTVSVARAVFWAKRLGAIRPAPLGIAPTRAVDAITMSVAVCGTGLERAVWSRELLCALAFGGLKVAVAPSVAVVRATRHRTILSAVGGFAAA